MAVDSQTKRRSVLGMTVMSLVIAPLADGTVANVDREHIIGLYAGIAPGGMARPKIYGGLAALTPLISGGLVR